jgi:hypothetical protein
VRAHLFPTAQLVARTSLADPDEATAVSAAWRTLARMLNGHAQRQDAHVVPHLASLAPALAAEIETRHDRCAGLERGISEIVVRLERAPAAERESLGRRMHRSMGALVIEHLGRMRMEEEHACRILCAHIDAGELARIERRMFAAIRDEEAAEWLGLVLTSADTDESAALLSRLRPHVPAAAWSARDSELEMRVGSGRWSEIKRLAESPVGTAGESAA